MGDVDINFSDGVRQLYMPSLNAVSKTVVGLREWLGKSPNFIPNSVGRTDAVELVLYDSLEALSAIAGDIIRLSSASLETARNISIPHINKRFLAWKMVEKYYSAFYSAHCLLKICNMGLTQIDARIIANIQARAGVSGITIDNLSSGLYCVKYVQAQRKLVLFKVKRYDDSHRGLWNRYADYIAILRGTSIETTNIDATCVRLRSQGEPAPLSVYEQLGLSDAQVIDDCLESIQKTLNQRGDNNWLSYIRNSINYNHSFGIWYPYKDYLDEYDSSILTEYLHISNPLSPNLEILATDVDIIKFTKCCNKINAMCLNLVEDLSIRHPENKSFLINGPLSYAKLYC